MTKLTEFQKAEIDRLNAELADAYAGGYAAGRVVALELAAGVCEARASYWDTFDGPDHEMEEDWRMEAEACAAAIRALAAAPADGKETG